MSLNGVSLPDWLHRSLGDGTSAAPLVLFWRITSALLLGMLVAVLYRWSRRGQPVGRSFLVTLTLLSTLIAMATQVIGDNVARAFGLVGALSVVRFRTKVKDAQDTTFVIFAVTVGMAAGSNQLPVALVGLLVVFLAARFLWPPRRANTRVEHVEKRLHVRLVPHGDHRAAIEAAIGACAVRSQLLAAAVIEKGKTLDLTYALSVRQDRDVAALVMELSMVDGVVSVELAGDSKK